LCAFREIGDIGINICRLIHSLNSRSYGIDGKHTVPVFLHLTYEACPLFGFKLLQLNIQSFYCHKFNTFITFVLFKPEKISHPGIIHYAL